MHLCIKKTMFFLLFKVKNIFKAVSIRNVKQIKAYFLKSMPKKWHIFESLCQKNLFQNNYDIIIYIICILPIYIYILYFMPTKYINTLFHFELRADPVFSAESVPGLKISSSSPRQIVQYGIRKNEFQIQKLKYSSKTLNISFQVLRLRLAISVARSVRPFQ